jgi:hypothetical protein
MPEAKKRVTLEGVKLMWAKLAEPNQQNDSPKYEVEMQSLSKEHIKLLKELDPPYTPNDGSKRVNKAGDSLAEKGFYCTPRSQRPVPVYDSAPKKMTLEDVAKIGNESAGNVTCHSYAYDIKGNKGVALGLDSVQVTNLIEYIDNPYGSVDGGYTAPELHEQPVGDDNVPY